MSRSGYSEDCEYLELYRQAVERAIKGKRGQAFLRELANALDVMVDKRLTADQLIDADGDVCAIGAVCKMRGIDMSKIEYYDPDCVASAVGIARSLAAEIEYMNDEWVGPREETPEQRWLRMRKWVEENLRAKHGAD